MLERSKKMTLTAGGVAVLIVALVSLNIISSKLFFRGDVTQDKVFTLSPGSKSLLQKLDDQVTVKLYFSRSLRDLPPMIKIYATRVEEMLREYAANANGNLKLQVIDPKPDTDDEEAARKYGIQGVRLPKGDELFFGAVFLFGDKATTIPYIDPRREEQLEYDISEALVNIRRKDKPKIGVVSWLPVSGASSANPFGGGGDPWVFFSELKKANDVQELETTLKDVPSDIQVLLVLHPKNPSSEFQYAVDQFVMRGGRLIVAVDPFSRTDLALSSRQAQATGQMPRASSDLPQLLDNWGVVYKTDKIVGDQVLGTQINAGGIALNYPLFMTMGEASFAKTPVAGSLHQVLFAESGELEKKEGSTYDFEPLIQTTEDSGTVGSMMAAYMGPQDLSRELKPDHKQRVVAAMVRGKFKSAFTARPPAEGETKSSVDSNLPAHKSEAASEASIVIFADTDFFSDQNSVDKMQFMNQVMIRPRNDNLNLIYNSVDLLGGSEDLINIRSKGRISRPFSRIVGLEKKAQDKWKEEEEKLNARLSELQKKLNELQAQRSDGSRLNLTAEQQREIETFRGEELDLRRKLRQVRRNLREDVEKLGKRLLTANMTVVPLAISGFGIAVFMRRSRRRAGGKKHA